MAEGVNAQISDRLVRRQLQVLRLEASLRRQVFEQLAVLESEIVSALKSNDPTEWILLLRRRQEIQRLLDEDIEPLIRERYQHIADLLDVALLRLAIHEAAAVETIVNDVADEQTIAEQPSRTQLRTGVVLGLFPSPTKPSDFVTFGSDWWKRQGQSLSQRIGDSLTVGVSLEENLTELARRVKGTSANAFQDGVMQKARDDASRLLTTQVTNAVSEAHVALAQANADQAIVIHVSILEAGVTCLVCIARHGKRYTADTHEPIGHDLPYLSGVPYHPACRCDMIPGTITGGAIPKANLDTWLLTQSAAFQDDLLGPTRAQMWREGRLSARDLLHAVSGRPLTLEELGA